MRLLNIFAALSGVLALGMLVLAAHALQPTPEDLERIKLAAYLQLGAAIFAGTLYTLAVTHSRSFVMLAPVGGITLILGWVALAFTKPGA